MEGSSLAQVSEVVLRLELGGCETGCATGSGSGAWNSLQCRLTHKVFRSELAGRCFQPAVMGI